MHGPAGDTRGQILIFNSLSVSLVTRTFREGSSTGVSSVFIEDRDEEHPNTTVRAETKCDGEQTRQAKSEPRASRSLYIKLISLFHRGQSNLFVLCTCWFIFKHVQNDQHKTTNASLHLILKHTSYENNLIEHFYIALKTVATLKTMICVWFIVHL